MLCWGIALFCIQNPRFSKELNYKEFHRDIIQRKHRPVCANWEVQVGIPHTGAQTQHQRIGLLLPLPHLPSL